MPTPIAQEAAPTLDGADREVARLTYRYDRLRAFFGGMLEPAWVTFSLIIAIRYFEMPDVLKALLPAAGFIGLLLNAFSISFFSKTGKPAAWLMSALLVTCAVLISGAAFSSSLVPFLVCIMLANIIFVQAPSLVIQIYSANYRPSERGGKVSTVIILSSLGGIVAGLVGGEALERNVANFPLVFAGLAVASLICAVYTRRIPSQPLNRANTRNPFKSFTVIWEDKLFGWLLLCWMLMGIANLMTIPLRIEYLADAKYGINATNFQIALITFVIPMTARMASTKIWGYLFDRMNFVAWRMAINFCFIASFVIYFNSTGLVMLGLGMALAGVALGGGNIGWMLWVTKLAPSEKTPAYMSAHTALTGLRGTTAPFLGYWALSTMSPFAISMLCAGLMLVANGMFATAWKSPRMRI